MARIEIETPVIFGALCKGTPSVPRALERALRAKVRNSVLLPFKVETRHLKNVMECMRLMDVVGLVVDRGHARAIARHVPKLHRSASSSGRVDIIIRKGRGYLGYCVERMAQEEAQRSSRSKPKKSKDIERKALRISVELLTDSMSSK